MSEKGRLKLAHQERLLLLREHIKAVFEEHPCDFYPSLLGYGKAFAERVLDKQDFAAFDPMVSDRSCQLRAIWLACLGRLKGESRKLSEEDTLMFGLARFLYESAIPAQHPIIGFDSLKTRSGFWPEDLFRLRNAIIRRRFLGQAKSLLAERVLLDMETWLREISPEDVVFGTYAPKTPAEVEKGYAELLATFDHLVYSAYSEIDIPIPLFFPGFVVVETLAAAFEVPLALTFRKVCRDKGGTGALVCQEEIINAFAFEKTTCRFEEVSLTSPSVKASKNHPVLVFSGHSYLGDDPSQIAEGASILQFLNRIYGRDLSIVDYIYAIMATHAARPGDRLDDDWKISWAPTLSAITKDYLTLAQQTGLSVHETVKNIFSATQENALGELVIDKAAYEVTHVCNASWEQLGVDVEK